MFIQSSLRANFRDNTGLVRNYMLETWRGLPQGLSEPAEL